MLSPVSSPSAVNSPVPDAGVNLDKLPNAQTGDGKGRIKGDTRIAFTGVEEGLTVGGAIVWGAVVIGGAYLTYQAVAKDEYGKTGLQRQGEVISDAAQQIWDGLNNTAGRLGQAVPSLDSIKQNITEAFRAADRAGGNVNKMAEGLMRRILGNGAPVATPVAPSYPTAPTAPSRPNSGTRPVAPARPNAAASQQAAAQAATQTFGKVQGSVDRMNDGVVNYYNDLAGGGTGKAGLQQVKQARQAVLSDFATLKKQVAASSADFKSNSQATLTGLQSALKANYNWIVGANAYRPGAALPNPPTTVAAGTPARGSGQDVASRVSSAAQGATNRTAAAPQKNKSSPASTAPTPSAAAPNNASAQQAREAQAVQTAQASAHRSVSTAFGKSEDAIKTVNDGVLSFYNAASGGRAARANGAFATPLKTVQSGVNELNGVVNTLKAEAGKCSPADQATVKRELKRLTDLVSSTQTWLGKAQAFSAGLSGPGGKHVAAPAMPQPPTLLSDPKRTQKGAEALRTRVDKAATAAAAKNPTVAATNGRPVAPSAVQGAEVVMNPNGFPAPASGVSVASEMPSSVTHTKPIWINTTTGAVSDKTQSGPGWLQATLGINGDSVPSGDKTTLDTSTAGAIVVFKKPPKKPDWKKWLQIAGTIAGTVAVVVNSAAVTGFFGGGFLQGEKQAKNADADRIAGASADNTALTMPVLNRADLLTPANKGKQMLKVWDGYFEQIDKRLQANPVASTEFKQEFTAAAANFKANLRGLVARLNTKGISAAESSDLVKSMAMAFSAPTLSVKPPQGASAELVGKYAKLNVTLAGLIKSMNDGVVNVVVQQVNTVPDPQPSVPGLSDPAQPPTSAAPTATRPADPNEAQLKKKVDDMFGDAVRKNGSVATPTAPVAPLPPASTIIKPTPVAPTTPTRPAIPKPVVPSVAPRATMPSPATAIANIDAAIAQAGLINPPAHTDKLQDIKFKSSMFLEASQRGDLAATTAARDKAKSLYAAIADVANRNNNPAANLGIAGGIVQGPIASLRAVIIDLNKQILEAASKPAARPKDVPTPSPSATPTEPSSEVTTPPSPMPSPSSTLAPEPATP
jgi:hypothetical protein